MIVHLTVISQITRGLFDSLTACKANFEYANSNNRFVIYDVIRYTFDREKNSEEQIAITFRILENEASNMSLININNIKAFGVYNT